MSETLRLVLDWAQRGELRVSAHGYDELAADGILAREVMIMMARIAWLGIFLTGWLLLLPQSTRAGEEDAVAFVNVNVIPMSKEGILTSQTVITRKGRIDEIGAASRIKVPKGVRVIDGQGCYLMPGLTDLHTHVATETAVEAGAGQLLLYLANGITTILNAGDFGEPLNDWAEAVRRGQIVSPNIYTAKYARGVRDGNPTNVQVQSPQHATKYVQQAKQDGYQFLKIYSWIMPEEFEALAKEANKQKMPMIGHIPWNVEPRKAFAGGLVMVAHAGGGGYWITHFESKVDPQRIPEAVETTRKFGVYVTPTLAVDEAVTKVWGDNDKGLQEVLSQPGMKYAHPSTVDRWLMKTRTQKLFTPEGSKPGDADAAFAFIKQYTKAFHDGGVKLLLGSDSPPVLLMPGFSIHREIQLLKEIGLKPEEVLRIATRNGGEFIGQHLQGSEPFGTVEVGKRADLLLLEGNPLVDLANLKKRRGVMVRGQWYSETDLQKRLEKLAASGGKRVD